MLISTARAWIFRFFHHEKNSLLPPSVSVGTGVLRRLVHLSLNATQMRNCVRKVYISTIWGSVRKILLQTRILDYSSMSNHNTPVGRLSRRILQPCHAGHTPDTH